MTLTSLLIAWVQSGICLLAGLGLAKMLGRRFAAKIYVIRGALLGAAALFILSPFVSVHADPVVPIDFSAQSVVPKVADVKSPSQPLTSPIQPTIAPASAPTPDAVDYAWLLPTVYSLGLAASFGLYAFGLWSLRALRRQAPIIASGPIYDRVQDVSKAYGLPAPTLRQSPDGMTPFVTGTFRKAIFLPVDWLETQSNEMVDSILQHELAHLAGRDLEWFLVARFACAILWCHPIAWMLNREMQSTAEERCDQEAVLSGIPQQAYARALLSVFERYPRARLVGVSIGAVVRSSSLTSRVQSLLSDDVRVRRPLTRKLKVALTTSVLASSALSAVLIAQPPPASSRQEGIGKAKPKPTDSSEVGFGPFKLKNGSSAKLEYLYQKTGKDIVAWLPNGMPVKVVQSEIAADSQSGSNGAVHCLIRLTNIPREEVIYQTKVGNGAFTASTEVIRHPDLKTTELWTQFTTKDIDIGSFQIAVPFGKFRTWTKAEPLDKLTAKTNSDTTKTYSMVFPKELAGKELKLIGTDSTGKEVQAGYYMEGSGKVEDGHWIIHLMFTSQDVKSYKIEYRDYQWLEFKNVHLTPDTKHLSTN
ncbi:MAG: M56 family metallopeptidase [Armatimonadetes bacterium]|nr:M56 family metallopeptidase [Armatimonadota bacterium]